MNCKHENCPLLEISLIPLTQGKYTIIDTEDYSWLSQWKWCALISKYGVVAMRQVKRKNVYMHRLILDAPAGMEVDHVNHNMADNRKQNLRRCSHAENMKNQVPQKNAGSPYKGVTEHYGGWRARITKNFQLVHLGTYKTEVEAAMAYDTKAKELFGEFAYLNWPE